MFLLRNARVIPELGCGRESLLWDVLIEGERISEIYPCADRKKSFMESYCGEVIDCQGKTLLPGLIDAHTHISIGSLEHESADFANEFFALFIEGSRQAKKYLEFGYTTIRDLGSSYGVACQIRDAVEAGLLAGPRMFTAGRIIGATEERKIVGKDFNIIADGCDEVRKAVRREIAQGANLIKFYNSTYPLRKGKPIFPMYTFEEVKCIVDTANSLGVYTAAHAYGDSVDMCLDAGVYTIEHGGGLSERALNILAGGKSFLVPTLAPNLCIEEYDGYDEDFKHRYFEVLADREAQSIAAAYRAGLKLGFGMDLGANDLEKRQGYEFLARQKYAGMRNVDMLLQATRYNAEILGIADVTGRICKGLCADLILMDGNPDEDIAVMMQKPKLVISRGKIEVRSSELYS